MYYLQNTFCFTDSMLYPQPLEAFRRMIGPELVKRMSKAKVMRKIRTDAKTFWLRFEVKLSSPCGDLMITGGIDGKSKGKLAVSAAHADKHPSARREICHCEVLQMAKQTRSILGFLEGYAQVVGRGPAVEVNRAVVCEQCDTVKSEPLHVSNRIITGSPTRADELSEVKSPASGVWKADSDLETHASECRTIVRMDSRMGTPVEAQKNQEMDSERVPGPHGGSDEWMVV